MGINHIHLLFPEGFPHTQVDLDLSIGEPDVNGVFTISGRDDVVLKTDATHFSLVTSLVTDNGDGTYTVTSE
jgi:hypothetical protein